MAAVLRHIVNTKIIDVSKETIYYKDLVSDYLNFNSIMS